MNIIETNFSWGSSLSKRSSTKYIILHHRAGNGDAESIHNQHLKNSWAGIGYHFYIRKDGSIFRGRPIDTVGAHTVGQNAVSVGVCFEGNYHSNDKVMPNAQFVAGQNLIKYLKKIYKSATVKRHSDFQATACPGSFFPFNDIIKPPSNLKSAEDIAYKLSENFFRIDDIEGFIRALDKAKSENSPVYWGYYKLANDISTIK